MNKPTLVFSNNQYVNNKKISNNMVKSKLITNLKKAEKILNQNKFKQLQTDLLLNLKNNNSIVVNINSKNNYKYEIYNGGSDINNTKPSDIKNNSKKPIVEENVVEEDEYIQKTNSNSKSNPLTEESSSENSSSTDESLNSEEQVKQEPISESTEIKEESESNTTDTTDTTDTTNTTNTSLHTPSILPKSNTITNTITNTTITESTVNDASKNTSQNKPWYKIWGGKREKYDQYDQQTYMVDSDDEDEESFIDKAKLNNKKYLSSLNVNKLRDIMREREMKLSKNGSYLKKNDMIKQIQKNNK
jgi:hypothetical protein